MAILGVGATALNLNYTDEISSERDRLAKAKDVELERFKVEKDTEIKNLEKGNLILRQDVGILEKSNLKAAKEVATLQIEVADAKRRQAVAETQLAQVTKRLTPRNLRIPSDMVLSILKTAPPGKAIIWYQQADAESALFATGLNFRLRDAGWKILEFKAIPSSIVHGAGNEDISLLMRDLLVLGYESDDSLNALLEVFRSASITWFGLGDPKLPDDTIRIIIHPKPS